MIRRWPVWVLDARVSEAFALLICHTGITAFAVSGYWEER